MNKYNTKISPQVFDFVVKKIKLKSKIKDIQKALKSKFKLNLSHESIRRIRLKYQKENTVVLPTRRKTIPQSLQQKIRQYTIEQMKKRKRVGLILNDIKNKFNITKYPDFIYKTKKAYNIANKKPLPTPYSYQKKLIEGIDYIVLYDPKLNNQQ